jgi:hypothetical protein
VSRFPSVLRPEAGKWQKESSFCEQATAKGPRRKQAKKLCPFGAGPPNRTAPWRKSFLLLFFKKEDPFFLPLACLLPAFHASKAGLFS